MLCGDWHAQRAPQAGTVGACLYERRVLATVFPYAVLKTPWQGDQTRKEGCTCTVAEHLGVLVLGGGPRITHGPGVGPAGECNLVQPVGVEAAHLPLTGEGAPVGSPPGPLQHTL